MSVRTYVSFFLFFVTFFSFFLFFAERKKVDYVCVNHCLNKGYQYEYCLKECSYE